MPIQVIGLGNIRLFELESWLHEVRWNDLNQYVDIAGDHRHTNDFVQSRKVLVLLATVVGCNVLNLGT